MLFLVCMVYFCHCECVYGFAFYFFLLFCNAQSEEKYKWNTFVSFVILKSLSRTPALYSFHFCTSKVLVVCYGANLFALLFLLLCFLLSFSLVLFHFLTCFSILFAISLVFSLYYLFCSLSISCSPMIYYALSCMLFHDLSVSLLLSFKLPTAFSPPKFLPHLISVISLTPPSFFV